jgi:hypothetical protein
MDYSSGSSAATVQMRFNGNSARLQALATRAAT